MKFLQPSLFLHGFLCGVAPILCTLTQSISDDTLWAMTVNVKILSLFWSYSLFLYVGRYADFPLDFLQLQTNKSRVCNETTLY